MVYPSPVLHPGTLPGYTILLPGILLRPAGLPHEPVAGRALPVKDSLNKPGLDAQRGNSAQRWSPFLGKL